MAWVKVPQEHQPLFLDALPPADDVQTLRMFGSLCAMVNGHMAASLFGRTAIARLSPADQRRALALEGAQPFDPMGNGRVMSATVMLPEAVMEDPRALRDWIARAIDYARTLPPKVKRGAAKKAATKKPPTRKPPTKKPRTKIRTSRSSK